MNVPRIQPREARMKVGQGQALLVCAYDAPEKFQAFHLEGGISLQDFLARRPGLAKDTELVFYCA